MKPRVYIETSVVSYLAARPSRDLLVAGHQQVTAEWWTNARSGFDLFISEAVLEEIRRGDAEASNERLSLIQNIPVLQLSEGVRWLVHLYVRTLGIPQKAQADVLHIAFAVEYNIDYLLTWNCSHLANGEIIRRMMKINQERGKFIPLILTPEELLP